MYSLKEKYLKMFKSWGQTLRQQHTYWYNMKLDYSQHNVDQFALEIDSNTLSSA